MISVIIQSRWNDLINMRRSISCFIKQNYKDKELILVIDQIFSSESYIKRLNDAFDWNLDFIQKNNIRIFSNLNSEFTHNNVGSMRNLWIQKARWVLALFLDDDEDIHADYLTKMTEYWKKYRRIIGKDFVLTPTLMYRHTGKIQNQWFSHFNYRLSRPIECILGQREWAVVQMYSWNSLFAPIYIFQDNKMDEEIDFVYEDLIYTHSLYKSWYPIIVTKNIKIYHMERDKTKLEQARIGNIYQAYRKSKHRIFFVRRFANLQQKTQFFIFWFIGQPLWLTFKAMIYKGQKKSSIIKNIWKWTIDWIIK